MKQVRLKNISLLWILISMVSLVLAAEKQFPETIGNEDLSITTTSFRLSVALSVVHVPGSRIELRIHLANSSAVPLFIKGFETPWNFSRIDNFKNFTFALASNSDVLLNLESDIIGPQVTEAIANDIFIPANASVDVKAPLGYAFDKLPVLLEKESVIMVFDLKVRIYESRGTEKGERFEAKNPEKPVTVNLGSNITLKRTSVEEKR